MAEGSAPGNTIGDMAFGTRNFLAFAQTPVKALQLLRRGTIKGTALIVSGADIKHMFGITEYPAVAAVEDSFGGAAFHRKGALGIETKAGTTFEAVQAMSEETFNKALAAAKATEQQRGAARN